MPGMRNSSWGRPRGASHGRDHVHTSRDGAGHALMASKRDGASSAFAGLAMMNFDGSGRNTLPAGAGITMFGHSNSGGLVESPCPSREGTGTLSLRENTAPLPIREGTGHLSMMGAPRNGAVNFSSYGSKGRMPSTTRDGSRPPQNEAWGKHTCRAGLAVGAGLNAVATGFAPNMISVSPRDRIGKVHSPVSRYMTTSGVPALASHQRPSDSSSRSPDRTALHHVNTPPSVAQQPCRWGSQVTPRVPGEGSQNASPSRGASPKQGSTPPPHTPMVQGGRTMLQVNMPVHANPAVGQPAMHMPTPTAASAVAARGRGMLQFGWNWWN